VAELADYLDLTVGQARQQFRELARRRPVSSGRQVTFLPVETLLCPAASFVVNHRHFGGSTAHQAPEPIPSLARLFSQSSPEPGDEVALVPRQHPADTLNS
jgi:putative restriction endonuclease